MSRTIDVSDLPQSMVRAIEALLNAYREQKPATNVTPPQRPIGWLRGRFTVPPSFFDPLPDDVLDLFEGKGSNAA